MEIDLVPWWLASMSPLIRYTVPHHLFTISYTFLDCYNWLIIVWSRQGESKGKGRTVCQFLLHNWMINSWPCFLACQSLRWIVTVCARYGQSSQLDTLQLDTLLGYSGDCPVWPTLANPVLLWSGLLMWWNRPDVKPKCSDIGQSYWILYITAVLSQELLIRHWRS